MRILPGISRVTRSKMQAVVTYNRLSRWYDLLAAGSEQPLSALGLRKLNVIASDTVLEIGFGTGHALLKLASAMGDSGKVVGIDISNGMIKVANDKLVHANLSQRVRLIQGDATFLPCLSDSFDAIFISFTLELFDNPEIPKVLSECQRVLKPGGRIGIVAMARDERENLPQQIYEWFHHHLPAYVDCRPIHVRWSLSMADFQIQNVERKWMWGLPVEICLAKKSIAEEVVWNQN